MSMPSLLGQVLGRYRLESLLGRGGMAEVYKATDEKLGRAVAVKVILPSFAADPQFRDRFLREARLIAGLEHRNILSIYDFGEHEGLSYLVMPHLGGGTLEERSRGRCLPPTEVVEIVGQLADALDTAHRAGILHRDIKPANVLIGGDGRVVLADFGIAKMFDGNTHLTNTGVVVGTPVYMAPELARGGTAEPASDLYSLGCLAFEMLVGRPPFEGENALSLLHQHVSQPVPEPSRLIEGLPPGVDPVITAALSKDPTARPSSCREFADALSTQVVGAPITRRPPTDPEAVTLHLGAAGSLPSGTVPSGSVPSGSVPGAYPASDPAPAGPAASGAAPAGPASGASLPGDVRSAMADAGAARAGGARRRIWQTALAVALVVSLALVVLRVLRDDDQKLPGAASGSAKVAEVAEVAEDRGGASREGGEAGGVRPSAGAGDDAAGSGHSDRASGLPGSADGRDSDPTAGERPAPSTPSSARSPSAAANPESRDRAPATGAGARTDGVASRESTRSGSADGGARSDAAAGAGDRFSSPPQTGPRETGGSPARSFANRGRLDSEFVRFLFRLESRWGRGRPARSDYATMLQDVEVAAERFPDNEGFEFLRRYGEGGLAYIDGNPERARQVLVEIRDRYGRALEAVTVLPIRFLGRNLEIEDWQLALAYGDPLSEAQSLITAAAAKQPNQTAHRLGKAVLLNLDGEYVQAAAAVQKLLPGATGNEVLTTTMTSFIAEQYICAGRYAEAARWYKRSIGDNTMRAVSAVRAIESAGGAEALRATCDAGLAPACQALQRMQRNQR